MIAIWTFLLSLLICLGSIAAVIYSFRNGNRVAIVLALDAAIIAALGMLLNATTRGDLVPGDVLLFCGLPLVLAAAAVVIGRLADRRAVAQLA